MPKRKPSHKNRERNIEQESPHCIYCGAEDARDVEHINGDESDSRPENLARACRSCNVKKGQAFAAAGLGVRTMQFNPESGLRTMADYRQAVGVLLGKAAGSIPRAVRALVNTPVNLRAYLASLLRTRENPGAETLGAWVAAHVARREGSAAEVAAARKLIRLTPKPRRSEFNREVWRRRKEKGVPF